MARNKSEVHRREAVITLRNVIVALGHDGMTNKIAEQISERFVDELAAHVREDLLDDERARKKVAGRLVDDRFGRRPPRKGRKS